MKLGRLRFVGVGSSALRTCCVLCCVVCGSERSCMLICDWKCVSFGAL